MAASFERAMERSLFQAFRDLAFREAGIRLGDGKVALVAARIGKRVRALGLSGEREYLELLESDDSGRELIDFLDAISTNFTGFFREPDHFGRLRDAVVGWARQGERRMRFWSAACSSGEEAWSMAMVLDDALAGCGIDWRILATDLSKRMVERASAGEYEESRLAPVPRSVLRRHFEPGPARGGGPRTWSVRPSLRARLVFRRMNLAQPPFPMRGPMEAVFCRNVMIYLDAEVRQRLVAEIERLLRPGGLLMIGHSETLTGIRCGLRMVVPSVFRKPEA
jgi:chemotaxis protein methyltransferase CheR